MGKTSEFINKCKKLMGKEVKVILKNGVNLYGILYDYIPVGKLGNNEEEIYINSKGNIMGLLKHKIDTIFENV